MLNAQNAKKACFTAHSVTLPANHYKRDHYWCFPSWALANVDSTSGFAFPGSDLLSSLLHLYFTKVNIIYPILHRRSFEQSIIDGYHLEDKELGAVLLLVCCLGARHLDSITEEKRWSWYQQVQGYRAAQFSPLYELQYHCLAVLFLHGMPTPMPTWTVVGEGIRKAVDMGVHRRKSRIYQMTLEDELMKRSFWVLIAMDRLISSFLGRPSVIRDEDFDLEDPVEFEDEYWTSDTTLPNHQPSQRLSGLSAFIRHLKLCEISMLAVSVVYAPKKPKLAARLAGDTYRQKVIEQLEEEMAKWKATLPGHLRWDSQHTNEIFFQQSAFLHALYYFVQMQIYKPSIFRVKHDSPSRTRCLEAANSSILVLNDLFQRNVLYCPELMFTIFTSATIILANMWNVKRQQIPTFDYASDISKVQKALTVLHACEIRDLLSDLSYGIDISMTPASQETAASTAHNIRSEDSTSSQLAQQYPMDHLATSTWTAGPSRSVFPYSTTGFGVPADSGFSPLTDLSWLSEYQEAEIWGRYMDAITTTDEYFLQQ
ncbi:hypothetical protein WG66_005089 [Moniliophthora roreri]|nr:hypothetical protein WG66_005089 [Moniliophthora roreri]